MCYNSLFLAFDIIILLQLAYDYKFDEEEDSKIACMCGAANCKKWMN